MEVGRIQQNYLTPQRQLKKQANPNFTGGVASMGKDLIDLIPAKKAINFLNKFEWLRGELGTIIITAFGTGLVAPLFIGFNPFVKPPKDATKEKKEEVRNNKLYTAMRQPISAGLAILFQVWALKPIDKFLDRQFNDPTKSKNVAIDLDHSLVNKKSYLETIIEEEMKAEGTTYADKQAFKNELARRVSARSDEQINGVAEQIKATGEIDVNGRKLPNHYLAEITNTNIDEYINDVKSHIISPEGLDFYKNRATLLVENEDYLKRVLGNLPTDNIAEYLKAEMKDAPENTKIIFEEILAHKPELMESRCARTLERIERIKAACGEGGFTPEKYLAKMQSDNRLVEDIVSQLEGTKIKDVANSDGDIIKQTLERLKQICTYDEGANKQLHGIFHDTETMQKNAGKISEKIYKDMAKGYKKFIEGGYKGFSQVAKVLTGVFITLPITCTALNWVYPRFMELFFPKLAGVKKEGGSK